MGKSRKEKERRKQKRRVQQHGNLKVGDRVRYVHPHPAITTWRGTIKHIRKITVESDVSLPSRAGDRLVKISGESYEAVVKWDDGSVTAEPIPVIGPSTLLVPMDPIDALAELEEP